MLFSDTISWTTCNLVLGRHWRKRLAYTNWFTHKHGTTPTPKVISPNLNDAWSWGLFSLLLPPPFLGFFPAEMVFTERVIPTLVSQGIKWVIVANNHISRACKVTENKDNKYNYANSKININCRGIRILLMVITTVLLTQLTRFETAVCIDKHLYCPYLVQRVPHWIQVNPSQSSYFSESISRGCTPNNAAPFSYRPHYAQYVDPVTGYVNKIIVVPAAMVMLLLLLSCCFCLLLLLSYSYTFFWGGECNCCDINIDLCCCNCCWSCCSSNYNVSGVCVSGVCWFCSLYQFLNWTVILYWICQAMSWQDGYQCYGTSDIDKISSQSGQDHPMLVLLAHDGDNAFGGGYSYYEQCVHNFVTEAQGKVQQSQ